MFAFGLLLYSILTNDISVGLLTIGLVLTLHLAALRDASGPDLVWIKHIVKSFMNKTISDTWNGSYLLTKFRTTSWFVMGQARLYSSGIHQIVLWHVLETTSLPLEPLEEVHE